MKKLIKSLVKKLGIRFKSISQVKRELASKGLVLVGYDCNFGIVKKEYEDLWYEMQYLNKEWSEEE